MMKKALILLILSSALLLCGCTDDIAAQGGIVLRGSSPTQPPEINVPADENVVYVSPSGTKYHTADCPLYKESFIPVTVEQALQEGKEPCSRCH